MAVRSNYYPPKNSSRLEAIAERWARSYRSLLQYDEGNLHVPSGHGREGVLWRIVHVGYYDQNKLGGSVPLLDNYLFLGRKSRAFDAALKGLPPDLQDVIICRHFHPGRRQEWAAYMNVSMRDYENMFNEAMSTLEKLV